MKRYTVIGYYDNGEAFSFLVEAADPDAALTAAAKRIPAGVRAYCVGRVATPVNRRHDEANAHLIAEAPAMLATLEGAERLLAAYVNHEEIEMCAFAERLDSIRDVIAKARKESSGRRRHDQTNHTPDTAAHPG